MLPIAATKQSQTRFDDENTDIRGSTSNLLQVPEGKAAGLRKWKGFTKMFGSKKQSSPSLRQKSLAINVCVASVCLWSCRTRYLYRMMLCSPQITCLFRLSRSMRRIGSRMTSMTLWIRTLCNPRSTHPSLRRSFLPRGDPGGGGSIWHSESRHSFYRDAGIRTSNRTTLDLTIPVYMYNCRTPADDIEFLPDRDHRDKGERTDRGTRPGGEGARRPTLYLVLDTDQDPSCPSEVNLLVGTIEEFRSQTGGGDELEWGL